MIAKNRQLFFIILHWLWQIHEVVQIYWVILGLRIANSEPKCFICNINIQDIRHLNLKCKAVHFTFTVCTFVLPHLLIHILNPLKDDNLVVKFFLVQELISWCPHTSIKSNIIISRLGHTLYSKLWTYFPYPVYGTIHSSLLRILSEHETLYGKIKKGNLWHEAVFELPISKLFPWSEIWHTTSLAHQVMRLSTPHTWSTNSMII